MNSLALFDRAGKPTREAMPRARQIRSAIQHADRVCPKWSETAFQFVRMYADGKAGLFTAEDVTEAAHNFGVPVPPHGAWGAVFQRAQREHVIERVDNEGKRANGNSCARYRSLIRMQPEGLGIPSIHEAKVPGPVGSSSPEAAASNADTAEGPQE